MANHYTYRVEWCADEDQYLARCVEISGFYASAPTAQDKLNDELRRRTPPAPPRPSPLEELKKIPCRPTGNGVQCKGTF